MKTKKCPQCGTHFNKPQNCSQKEWEYLRVYCSRKCSNISRKGVVPKHLEKFIVKKGQILSNKTTFTSGHTPWNKGKKMPFSNETRKMLTEKAKKTIANETPEKRAERIRKAINNRKTGFGENHKRGKEHHAWKETGLGYTNTHKWINKVKPRTGICEICGLKRKTEYSNVDHKYRRVIKDYMELCKKCHNKWELDHKL